MGNNDEKDEYKRNLPSFKGIGSLKQGTFNKDLNNEDKKKNQEAETKRQKALAEKWDKLQNQKTTIANALKGESINKKIKFDEDGSEELASNTIKPSKKMSLFEDEPNETTNEEFVSNFKLKLKFDGEKGQKLFKMQTTKSTGDNRFLMDKRFFDEQEMTEKINDNEIEKQMNILEDVVGRSLTKPKKDIMEDRMFNMVRYDPTQEEHKIYIKDKPDLPKQKRSKKQKPKVEEQKIVSEPIIDTQKYFKVENKLKDVFSNENQFRLTSLFPTPHKSEIDRNEYQTKKITKHKKILGKNPFIDDSSDSDNEEEIENKDNTITDIPSEKLLGSRGVWRESFFFKINDSRFKDAEEFYDPKHNKNTYSGSQDPRFIKKRELLREFLKTKDKRHRRELGKKMFSKKLGGTHNSSDKTKKNKVIKSKKLFSNKNHRITKKKKLK
ncbi:nucleolar protein 8-like [Daktulosphaira vitifoliae]|uniref:nucleolar protein 8-like n=1 Tax=Daktulosphaira vitifoliae TaxID=58002 RepID=UPI0021A9BB82|nr:nucleolar protein 8-like [Daktulosphaira vitifoliae]XP_050524540.1 nucleolar protein 8-like [Daktulosphaira vitifoliae]